MNEFNFYFDREAEGKAALDNGMRIKRAIQAFSMMTDVPVTFFDETGDIMWEFKSKERFCSSFDIYRDKTSSCFRNLKHSFHIAEQCSEPYIFLCKAGLLNIAFPLIVDGKMKGTFIAGPLLMGKIKERTYLNIFSINNLAPEQYPSIITKLNNLKSFTPQEVSSIAILFESSVLSTITPNQQTENRLIQSSKSMLLQGVKSGDSKKSQKILKDFFRDMSVMEAGDHTSIKNIVMGVCGVLLRSVIESYDFSAVETERLFQEIEEINKTKNIAELSGLTTEFIETLIRESDKRRIFV